MKDSCDTMKDLRALARFFLVFAVLHLIMCPVIDYLSWGDAVQVAIPQKQVSKNNFS
jgi:hypothetical protein